MNKFFLCVLASAVLTQTHAQNIKPSVDYARAEQFLSYKTYPLYKWAPQVSWQSDDQLSYEYDDKNFQLDLKTGKVNQLSAPQSANQKRKRATDVQGVKSPDGNWSAYIKDFNLWVRNIADGRETQLTTDGEKNYGYATDNAGWKHSDEPILRWSPDSKKIATFKQDERNVGDMYLVSTNVGHPKLMQWKYPLPGDSVVAMIERVVIDVPSKKVVKLNVAPDFHRGTLSDDIASSGTFDDVDWKADGTELAFVSTSRDHKNEKFRIANTATGAVREVFEETVKTQYESGQGTINWKYLPASNEIIWYSERSNWGHLYLYNAKTGKVKNQITKGNWLVTEIVKVDEKNRTVYFYATGLDAKNPYFVHFCKAGFDGKGFKDLTPETGTHSVDLSEQGNYFIDDYSQPDVPNTVVAKNISGKIIAQLGKADVAKLKAKGWKAPIPVKLLAGDSKTDIYGLVYIPSHMEAGKKYPVIDYIYPGPQGGSVGYWGFSPARGDHQALAELGFIVINIEGTSNPLRSKSYHDMSYGNMAINTLPDQIAAIRQLAKTYPIDTTKVGIWGHSGGGFATACALFRYPDFFKVGIAESGNHDNRNYEDDWGERYNGLLENADYEAQANQLYAKNLKGKLMLAHGLMDDNVPPYNMWLVVDALNKANKDYDLVVFPHAAHGFGADAYYMMRKRWDYFVSNLANGIPPKEYKLGGK